MITYDNRINYENSQNRVCHCHWQQTCLRKLQQLHCKGNLPHLMSYCSFGWHNRYHAHTTKWRVSLWMGCTPKQVIHVKTWWKLTIAIKFKNRNERKTFANTAVTAFNKHQLFLQYLTNLKLFDFVLETLITYSTCMYVLNIYILCIKANAKPVICLRKSRISKSWGE